MTGPAPAGGPATVTDPGRGEGWRPLLAIVALYALSRFLLMLVGVLTTHAVDGVLQEKLGGALAMLWCRWDCGWYLGIVEHGYSAAANATQPGATNLAFFPLLPLLIRAWAWMTGMGPVGSGIVVVNLAFAGALVYIYRYARLTGLSTPAGLVAVAILCFVPQSFVFSAIYTESLFLLLLAAAMFHLRRGEFLVAGVAAALLSATRSAGVFFIVFALAWIVRNHGIRLLLRPWHRPQAFVPVVLAPLGLFCFWWFCYAFTGDAFAQASSVGHGWGWRAAPPWDNLIAHLRYDASSRFWTISSLIVFTCSLLLLYLRRFEEFLFCLAVFLLLWSGTLPNSLLRYSIVLFPAWLALAQVLERRPLLTASTLAGMALMNGFLMTAWTLGKSITI